MEKENNHKNHPNKERTEAKPKIADLEKRTVTSRKHGDETHKTIILDAGEQQASGVYKTVRRQAMKKGTVEDTNATELRHRAEKRLAETQATAGPQVNYEDTLKLIHELQVHQIELEMQNDELMHAQAELEISYEKYSDLYDFAPIGYITLTEDGIIREANLTCAALLRVERSYLINRNFAPFVSDKTRSIFYEFLQKVFESNIKKTCELVLAGNDDNPKYILVEAVAYGLGGSIGRKCRMVILDITERMRVALEIDRLVNALQQALAQIKVLSGLLPICSYCKKIRDDKGYWNQLESYISSHSDALFSHSICPECRKNHYPDKGRSEIKQTK